MTRIPESRELILKRVCSNPVQAPANIPAKKPASEASGGLTLCTSRIAATDAPRVIDPSAVMSGNAKIRKLIKTPKASSERISPMVKVPIRRLMPVAFSLDIGDGSDPASAAHKFALMRPGCLAVVRKKVEHALQALSLKQGGGGGFQINLSLLERTIRKCGGVKMSLRRAPGSYWPQQGRHRPTFRARRDATKQNQGSRI